MAEKKASPLRLLLGPAQEREQAARRDFAIIRRRVQAAEDALGRCVAALARQDEWARNVVRACDSGEPGASRGAGPTAGLGFYRQFAADLREALQGRRAELARAQAELQTRREELAAAMKQRKGLETAVLRCEAEEALDASRYAAKEQDEDHAARLAWQSRYDGPGATAALGAAVHEGVVAARANLDAEHEDGERKRTR